MRPCRPNCGPPSPRGRAVCRFGGYRLNQRQDVIRTVRSCRDHIGYSRNTARTPSSTARRSSLANTPPCRISRDRSTARIWSHTATAPSPADRTETTIGGRGTGPVDSGTTTTVLRARFTPSAVSTTTGRGFRISEPRVGSNSTHQIDPRRMSIGAPTTGWHVTQPCRSAAPVSVKPSPMVAASHSAISSLRAVSCSTARAAR